jgi:predicted nucleic acid-binding protein
MPLCYADASAVVKIVLEQEESTALRAYLADVQIASSELLLTEVPRALRRVAAENRKVSLESSLQRAAEQLDSIALRPVDEPLLLGAGLLAESALRSLDAIHVVTALHVYPIDAFVTYDKRQAAVARRVGLQTVAPGAE